MELLQQFESALREDDKSAKTVRGYISDLTNYTQWYRQTFDADVLTAQPMDLVEYKSYLQTVQKLSASSLNRHIASLRSFYSWAAEKSLITVNPAVKVKMKKVQENTAPASMTKTQFFSLIGAVKGVKNVARRYRDMTAIYLMRYAGLRVSETCSLQWEDVDFVGKTLRVTNGKGNKLRVVPLNDKLVEVLNEWKQVRGEYKTADSPYVLISTRTERCTETAIQGALQKYFAQCNMDQFSCHSLRHTCGKSLIDAGIGIEKVARILGHSSLETTKLYVRPTQEDLLHAINMI